MIVDIILGNNIDTEMWICNLKAEGAENIVVINYEYNEELADKEGIMYLSPQQAQEYIRKFDTKNYYKSMYAFPGMHGNMSSLHRRNND